MQDAIEHWRRADRIVRQALELSDTSRAGFVAEACGDDRELRELVERLLREGERTGELRTGAALNRALGEQDAERLLAEAGALLDPGSRIGHYEIEERIGAGGMGVVYRASDVRLKRPVAIKALSPHLAADATALARFRREAEILATVSDPGIAAVYSLEEHEGASYLVMEYVAGETLAERLERGALSLERALHLAGQMAGALELAHGRGVVHRDLKPGNVMLDDDGNVKLVDFGLARLVPGFGDGGDGSEATTRVQRLTSSGMLVGTAPYISPEQVRGARTDQRTDVWAFGCVLYEMISGVSPFRREIPVDTLTAILRQDPDWARLPSATPASLRRLLRRCLEKDPERRLRHLGDARLELDQAGEELATGAPSPDAATGAPSLDAATATPPPDAAATTPSTGPVSALREPRVLALAGAAFFLGALGAWAWLRPGPAPTGSEAATRLVVPLPAGQRLVVSEGARPLALSPDGRTLAYVAEDSGVARLHLRDLGRFDSRAVAATEGAQQPFFSPDGRRVGFFADGVVKVVAVSGGSPITVGPGPTIPKGGSWGADDRIVWAGERGGLHALPATGGAGEPLVGAGDDGDWYHWPEVLPHSRGILFAAGGLDEGGGSGIAVRTPDGEIRLLGPGTQPRYLPTGHLVYYERGERLRLVPFDLDRLRVTGAPVSAVDDVFRAWAGGGAYFAVSETGTLVFVAAGLDRSLVWVDRDGRATPAVEEVRGFRFPRLSPDGDRVAVTIDPRPSEIWVYDLARGGRVRLARGGHSILSAWGPGGAGIAYGSDVGDGLSRIFRRSVDGGGEAELLVGGDHHVYPMSWSNEGRYLAYVESHPTRRLDVWVADVGGGGDPIPIATGAAGETAPRFSPDGRWLAYQSDETGRTDVYLVSFPPGRGDRTLVSTGGGFDPVWSVDGTELFYRRGDELVAVDVETVGAGIELGEPRILFRGPYDATQPMNYSVSPDGSRFLMVLPDPDAGLDRFHVVLDWFAEISGAS